MTPLSPILLICFNRPWLLSAQLAELSKLNCSKVYISCDGPRSSSEAIFNKDFASILEIKSVILKFDDVLDICAKYQDRNLGCSKHCTTAIKEFLHVSGYGVIIEDDIQINGVFLAEASRLLANKQIRADCFAITQSFFPLRLGDEEKYLYSKYLNVWGWGTWREKFDDYELCPRLSTNKLKLYSLCFLTNANVNISSYWFLVLRLFSFGQIDGWDHQLYLYMWTSGQKTLVLKDCFSSNLGFDSLGTTMKRQPIWYGQECALTDSSQYDLQIEARILNANLFSLLKLALKSLFLRKVRYPC